MLVCFSVPLGISMCIYVIGHLWDHFAHCVLSFRHSCKGLFILVWEGCCLFISPLPPAIKASLFLVSSTCFYLSLRVPLQEHTIAREHSQTDGSMWWCHIFEWECSSHLPLSSLPSDHTGTHSIKREKRRWGMGRAGSGKPFCLLWNLISPLKPLSSPALSLISSAPLPQHLLGDWWLYPGKELWSGHLLLQGLGVCLIWMFNGCVALTGLWLSLSLLICKMELIWKWPFPFRASWSS